MIHQQLIQKYLRLKEAVYKKYSRLHHVEHLEGPRVLVLSPHPDDDVFGCGGTIIRHLAQGHEVFVCYLTDGSGGIPGKKAQEVAAIRQQEATEAAGILGVLPANLHFMGAPDGHLQANTETVRQLADLLGHIRPDLIYLPSFTDNHTDHFQTNLLLKAVLKKPVMLSVYEIWTPFVPNRLVDISEWIDQKTAAMRAHQSQLAALRYDEAILGLNSYRALMYPKKRMRYAEAFLFVDSREYFELF